MVSSNVVNLPGLKEDASSGIDPRPFRPCTLFYHVTRPECVAPIEREGLKADSDGYIRLCTDLIAADAVAANQVFADPYVVFWLQPAGITGALYADDAAESTRQLQCVLRQERVKPQSVHYLGTLALVRDVMTPWMRLLDASRGFSRQQSEAMFAEALKRGRETETGAAAAK